MALTEWRLSSLLIVAFLYCFEALSPTSADLSAPKASVHVAAYDSLDKAAQHLRKQSVERVWLLDVDYVGLKTFANIRVPGIVKVHNEELYEICRPIAVAFTLAYNYLCMHTVAVRVSTINVDVSACLLPAELNVYEALQHLGLDAAVKISSPQSCLLLCTRLLSWIGRLNQLCLSSFYQPLSISVGELKFRVYTVQSHKPMRNEVDESFEGLRKCDDPVNEMNCYSAATLGYRDSPFMFSKKGLGVGRVDCDHGHPCENAATYARNLKPHLLSGLEVPKKHGVEAPTFCKSFADRSSIRKPSRMLGEVVLHAGETADVGANATEFGQVSLSSPSSRSWCIAKDYATPDSVQGALDWACGFGGADCSPIQLENACFVPNTVYNHASYAFNSYYQIHQHASGTCDFEGVATVTYEDPSYPGCSFPFRAGQPGAPVGGASKRHIFVYQAFSGVLVLLLM